MLMCRVVNRMQLNSGSTHGGCPTDFSAGGVSRGSRFFSTNSYLGKLLIPERVTLGEKAERRRR